MTLQATYRSNDHQPRRTLNALCEQHLAEVCDEAKEFFLYLIEMDLEELDLNTVEWATEQVMELILCEQEMQ